MEIMIVVVIIGILAALAVPAFKRTKKASQVSRMAKDLHTFAEGFSRYELANGMYPPDITDGNLPVELDGYIDKKKWEENALAGEEWGFLKGAGGTDAAIYFTGSNIEVPQMRILDSVIDDGDLASGRFTNNGGRFTFSLLVKE